MLANHKETKGTKRTLDIRKTILIYNEHFGRLCVLGFFVVQNVRYLFEVAFTKKGHLFRQPF